MHSIRIALSLLSWSGIALAASLGSSNPALVTEIAARRASLPTAQLSKAERKQKAALDRADKSLAHDGATLAANLADARKVAGALDAAFPGDAPFDALLATLVDGLGTGLQAKLAAITSTRDALADGAIKKRATKKIDKATAAVAAAASASTRSAALKSLSKAAVQVAAGEKILGGGGGTGGPTTTALTIDVGNPATDHAQYPSTPAGPLDHLAMVASGTGASSIFTLSGGADGMSGTTYSLMFFVLGPGEGDRPMSVTGSSFTAIPGSAALLSSGSVHFTTWNPGQQKCAGTYSASFGATEVSGAFSSIAMIVQ